jgi:hypothetical protein
MKLSEMARHDDWEKKTFELPKGKIIPKPDFTIEDKKQEDEANNLLLLLEWDSIDPTNNEATTDTTKQHSETYNTPMEPINYETIKYHLTMWIHRLSSDEVNEFMKKVKIVRLMKQTEGSWHDW